MSDLTPDAETTMYQASMTAEVWAQDAKKSVELNFNEYPTEAKAHIISAFIRAAATDELAMTIRSGLEADAFKITREDIAGFEYESTPL